MYRKMYDDYIKDSMGLYETIKDKKVISVDSRGSRCLDNAFSIEKDGNGYIMDVYLPDVVTFLKLNKPLAHETYKRALTHYYKNEHNDIIIPMLPYELCSDLLSLNNHGYKNVIHFTFYIDAVGIIQNYNVKLSRVLNKYPLFIKSVKLLLNGKRVNAVSGDIKCLSEIAPAVLYNFGYNSARDAIDEIIALPSLLINRLIAYDANCAIYKNSKIGLYTRKICQTTNSATPLRNFSSDINLALYMHQYNLGNISDDDVYMIEDNLDEIIEHLNETEYIDRYIKKLVKDHIIL